MKQIILAFAIAVAWAFPMEADETAGAGVRAAISAQFDAFRSGDVKEAFGYASPSIRQMFRSADVFGGMVENGYPMVWRPAETRFLELRQDEGGLWQRVLVRDQAGAWHTLDYRMVRLGNAWRIDGVERVEPAEA